MERQEKPAAGKKLNGKISAEKARRPERRNRRPICDKPNAAMGHVSGRSLRPAEGRTEKLFRYILFRSGSCSLSVFAGGLLFSGNREGRFFSFPALFP